MITTHEIDRSNPALRKIHIPVSMIEDHVVHTLRNYDTEGYAKFVNSRGGQQVELILLDKGNNAFGIRRVANEAYSTEFKTTEVRDALLSLVDTNRKGLTSAFQVNVSHDHEVFNPLFERGPNYQEASESPSQSDLLGVAHFTAELLKDADKQGVRAFAEYDEHRDGFRVGVVGEFDKIPDSIRDELLKAEALHVGKADHGTKDVLYFDAESIPGASHFRVHDYGLSLEANEFLNDVSKVNHDRIEKEIGSARSEYYHQMTLENTPDEYLHPDADDGYSNKDATPLQSIENYIIDYEIDEREAAERYGLSVDEYRDTYLDGHSHFEKALIEIGVDPQKYWAEKSLNRDGSHSVSDGSLSGDEAPTLDDRLDNLEAIRHELEEDERVEAGSLGLSVEEYRVTYLDGHSYFDQGLIDLGIDPKEYWGEREASSDGNLVIVSEIPDAENALNVTMLTPQHLLSDVSEDALDELHDARILVDNGDDTTTLRVEIDDEGQVIEPYGLESTLPDVLSNEAMSVVDQFHTEFKDDIAQSVQSFQEEQAVAEADAVEIGRVERHLQFLLDDTMNSKGWIKLDVPAELADQYDEQFLRDNGVNVAHGKMAMLVSIDDNGRPSLNSRATEKGSFAEAFEQDMFAIHEKTILSQASFIHGQKEDARFERMQHSLNRQGYDLGKNENGKYVITAKEEHHVRPDGVKSYMANPDNLKLENREFSNMASVIAAAKAVDNKRAADQKAVHDQLGVKSFVVLNEKKLDAAIQLLKEKPDRVVETKAITGETVKLAYNKSRFELVAKSGGKMVTPVGENSREYLREVKASLSEKGLYCRPDKFGSYEIGSVYENKPRYSEKSVALAAKAAYHMSRQVDAEKAKQLAMATQTSKSQAAASY
ncbi:hypothetical protein L3V16_21395 [Brucella ciceri]|uniref:hypothetical protein n=1 Tax=Brucella ciceri TaxID=391287 RepID=UPI000DE486A3|nr:hypothetical protein [Brucella ciceri]MCH6206383.1 hypothetical protein [Brucella ciceri]